MRLARDNAVLYAALVLVLLTGCASWVTGKPDVKPEASSPAQMSVAAYATIDKTYIAVKRAAQAKLADPSLPYTKAQLQRTKDDADTAKLLLDTAQTSLAAGDLSTTLGKLQAAQHLLDALSLFLSSTPP